MPKVSELKTAVQIAAKELADRRYGASTSEPRWRTRSPCASSATGSTVASRRLRLPACSACRLPAFLLSVRKHVDHLCATAPSLCIRSGNAGDSAAWPQP